MGGALQPSLLDSTGIIPAALSIGTVRQKAARSGLLCEACPFPIVRGAAFAKLMISVDIHLPRVAGVGFRDGDVVIEEAQGARPGGVGA